MKTAAIELNSPNVTEVAPITGKARVGAYLELTKPRITVLIMLTSAAGFALGSRGAVNYVLLAHALIGVGLLSSGIATLNQFIERDLDGLMRRTADRPLPSGRLFPIEALWFGVLVTAGAEVYLAVLVNTLTSVLGLTVIAGYLFVYTPLKTRTSLSTALGAFPGAMPPLMGWTAARGEIDIAAWVLFAILFLWQFPHFLAIAWMYREDYARAGFEMISKDDNSGARSASQSVLFCILLLFISGGPAFLKVVNYHYLTAELILNGLFIFSAMRFLRTQQQIDARRLFLTSIIYLPLLLAALVFTKI